MCGFISIFAPDRRDVLEDVLAGLLAIQHRGQDAAGVVTYDGSRFHAKKGLGLVRDVFGSKHLQRVVGNLAVGHVRYPTVGSGDDADVQPFWIDYFPIGMAMAHNGNVTNFRDLKDRYFPSKGTHLTSNCDLEAVLLVMAQSLQELGSPDRIGVDEVFDAVAEVFSTVRGAYSVVGILAGKGMFAFRDPYGIKPIILGERELGGGKAFAVASESVVLDVIGYGNKRDLAAGEAVFIDRDRNVHTKRLSDSPHRPCIFEQVYFARPDSFLDEVSVYKTRLRMGEAVAKKWLATGRRADVVIPVPESARTAAQAMAQVLGLPCRDALVKSRYIGRTFIMPSNGDRRLSVRQKLNPIRIEFEGKRVLLVDDSIVRGNTAKELVRMARGAGASEVHLASYSSPLRYPCPYGVDMSTKREFIARDRSEDEVARELGCDSLLYQNLDDMVESARVGNAKIDAFCTACFDGNYPTGDVTPEVLASIEDERLRAQG